MKIQLVCKPWQSIAINTSTLWSHILVSLPIKNNLQYHVDWIRMQHHYLDLYLSRSRQASLKVFIGFDGMLDAAYAAREQLSNMLGGVIGDVAKRNSWLLNIQWSSLQIPHAYSSLCASLIQKVVGKDGQHMLRWSEMDLLLPRDDKLAPRIQQLFDHNAPQLKRLSVIGLEDYSKGQLRLFRSLSSLPALSELVLSSLEFLEMVPPCPLLKKLEIDLCFDDFKSCQFHLIGTFPLLDELSLRGDGDGGDGDEADEDFSLPLIHLPDLKLLYLCNPPHPFVQALRVNQLDKLVILQPFVMVDTTPIANVCQVAKSFEWDYLYSDGYGIESQSDVFSMLFAQLHQVHTIAIPHDAREVAQEVVAECRARGQLESLKSVLTFESNNTSNGYVKSNERTPLITL